MNDTAIKNYAVWARRELIGGVRLQMARWAIDEEGSVPASADVLRGEPLNARQRTQRAELLEACRKEGAEALVERAAYTWFNRLAAIRFMELHDYLPCGMRMLSAPDGSFDPQALREALHVDIEGLDRAEMAALVQAGEREPQFRYLLLRQCDELASCMPAVFERVGSAMELLLPDNLLGEGSVVERMVSDIPESDWIEGVEIVGWMYQYYVSERKDEVFASFKKGKKADRSSIAPATQLFTPAWIVRYLVENSLGRLWMLNRPSSLLVEEMPYFVKLDEDCETEFKKISGPEDITVVDPACGSGHILVYAFDLLAKMYLEDGYTARDAARLILEKNISGMEIDPRAAAMASFALTMKALELDSRFLRRAVAPRITILSRVEFESEELELLPMLAKRPELLDAAAHLDECGSLLEPSEADMAAVAGDLAALAGEPSLFAASAAAKLERLRAGLAPLARRYDAVVANPPYMGIRNVDAWFGSWVRRNYPDGKYDIYACFIARMRSMVLAGGLASFVTIHTWAVDKSAETLRKNMLTDDSLICMMHMDPGVMPIAFETSATILAPRSNASHHFARFLHVSKSSMNSNREINEEDFPKLAYYRRRQISFLEIPSSILAYWASDTLLASFTEYPPVYEKISPRVGIQTGDTDLRLKFWWEVSVSKSNVDGVFGKDMLAWVKYKSGGSYRKWYGNGLQVVRCDVGINNGRAANDIAAWATSSPSREFLLKEMVSWSDYGLGPISFRYCESGHLFDIIEPAFIATAPRDNDTLLSIAAFGNSSVTNLYVKLLMSGRHKNVGKVARLPFSMQCQNEVVSSISRRSIDLSKVDWNTQEASWDFQRNPLV